MTGNLTRTEVAAQLRQQAEEMARKEAASPLVAMSPEDMRRALHELRVHQIELEMQNAELRRTQAELLQKAAILEAHLGSSMDGILIVDRKGTKVIQNQRCVELWQIPKQIADCGDDAQQVAFVRNRTVDPEAFARKVVHLYSHPDEASHDEVTLKDGTVLDRYSAPVTGEDGTCIGRVWTFRDITERKQTEDALRESEGQLQAILESTHDGVLAVDSKGRLIRANRRFAELWRIPPALLARRDDQALLAHVVDQLADPKAFLNKVQALYGSAATDMDTIAFKDGRVFERHSSPLLTGSTVTGRVWSFHDISERKQAEETLVRERSLLRTLIDNLPDLIYAKDRDGRFVVANLAVAQAVGLSTHAAVVGKIDSDFFPEDWAARLRAEELEVMQSGRALLNREDPILDTAGNQHWGSRTKVPLRDSVGGIVGLVGIGRDITERKRAEEALRASEERLQRVFHASPAAIAISRLDDGRFLDANEAFLQLYGYTREEVVGYTADQLRMWQSPEPERTIREALEGARPVTFEVQTRRKDGGVRDVLASLDSVELAGVPCALGTLIDITERKRAEAEVAALGTKLQEAQRMELVGRLAGGVAHEFNNRLMGIMSYVELCRDELPPEHPVRGYLDEITAEANHSADITKQLLAFARKQVIAPKVLDLNDALAAMLKMLQHLMGEDIALSWMPGTNLWPIKIDPGQLDQILANLCVNARDAIAGVGKVTIETANTTLDEAYSSTHAKAAPGEYVKLAVSDSGCGMSKDVLAHIFEPFYTTKDVGRGTGLGLATVYGIVRQNSGHIDVCSDVGKGTTFSVYLPRAASEADTGSNVATPAELPRRTETVLLAEDEKSVRVTSRLFLEALGYTVLAAETPEEALRLAGAHSGPIHLLITDVIMPGMNGPYLAAFLAGEHPNLKCLFMSGYTADVMLHRGTLKEGMPFLSKPFSRYDLARKVREVLDGD